MKRKGGGILKGVPTTQSVYYMWFEYLRRSERYRDICHKQGVGSDPLLKNLYAHFGDVHTLPISSTGFVEAAAFYDEHKYYLYWVAIPIHISALKSWCDVTIPTLGT